MQDYPYKWVIFRPFSNLCGFSVDFGRDFPIGVACEVDVEEGNAFICFRFASEFDSRVDAVENVVEDLRWVFVVVAASETRAARAVAEYQSPDVVHIDLEVAGKRNILFFGFFHCEFHGVNHPYLGYSHHQ